MFIKVSTFRMLALCLSTCVLPTRAMEQTEDMERTEVQSKKRFRIEDTQGSMTSKKRRVGEATSQVKSRTSLDIESETEEEICDNDISFIKENRDSRQLREIQAYNQNYLIKGPTLVGINTWNPHQNKAHNIVPWVQAGTQGHHQHLPVRPLNPSMMPNQNRASDFSQIIIPSNQNHIVRKAQAQVPSTTHPTSRLNESNCSELFCIPSSLNHKYQEPLNLQLAGDLVKLSEKEKREIVQEREAAGIELWYEMNNNALWTHEKLSALSKSEIWQEREAAGIALRYGMNNNALWAHEKLSAWSKSEIRQERNTAGRVLWYGMQRNAPWAHEKLSAWSKSEIEQERDVAGRALWYGMQSNAPWTHEKLSALSKSEIWQEREAARIALRYGMNNNAPWAHEKLSAWSKSEIRQERDVAGIELLYGMNNNAPWAHEKLSALSKSEIEQERDAAGIVLCIGMQRNAPWAYEKLSAWSKSEIWQERDAAGIALRDGMNNNVPWAQEKLSTLSKSGIWQERDAAGRALRYGMNNNAPWAQEKLSTLSKSGIWQEGNTVGGMLYIGMQSNAPWAQEKLAAWSKSEIAQERDTASKAQIFIDYLQSPKTTTQQETRFDDFQNLSLLNQEIPKDYDKLHKAYLMLQKDLQYAYQENDRLKSELGKKVHKSS